MELLLRFSLIFIVIFLTDCQADNNDSGKSGIKSLVFFPGGQKESSGVCCKGRHLKSCLTAEVNTEILKTKEDIKILDVNLKFDSTIPSKGKVYNNAKGDEAIIIYNVKTDNVLGTLKTHQGKSYAVYKCRNSYVWKEFDVRSFTDYGNEKKLTSDTLFTEDTSRNTKDIKQCRAKGVKNCRAVRLNHKVLTSSSPQTILKLFSGSDVKLKLKKSPKDRKKPNLNYQFSVVGGGMGSINYIQSTKATYGTILPFQIHGHYKVEPCGKSCNVIYQTQYDHFK